VSIGDEAPRSYRNKLFVEIDVEQGSLKFIKSREIKTDLKGYYYVNHVYDLIKIKENENNDNTGIEREYIFSNFPGLVTSFSVPATKEINKLSNSSLFQPYGDGEASYHYYMRKICSDILGQE
jgi:hypothetical protein